MKTRATQSLATFLGLFGLAGSGLAQEIVWEFEATYPSVDGGGTACGVFLVDVAAGSTLEDQVTYWDIEVDATGTETEHGGYYVGDSGQSWSFGSPTSYFIDTEPAAPYVWRGLFFENLPAPLLTTPGTVVLPVGACGELLQEDPTSGGTFRVFQGEVTLTGTYLADYADDDVYAEGGRLPEVARSGKSIDLISGAFTHRARILEGASQTLPFAFDLFYDSEADDLTTGGVGVKWTHSFEWYLVAGEDEFNERLEVVRGDRAADFFDIVGENSSGQPVIETAFPQSKSKLEFIEGSAGDDDYWVYTDYSGLGYIFPQVPENTIELGDNERFALLLGGIIDKDDNLLGLNRDQDGRLVEVTEPAGNVAVFTYGSNGSINSIDYGNGAASVSLEYDAQDNLILFTAPNDPGTKARFSYDANSLLLTGEAVLGTTGQADIYFTNTYDSEGRVSAQTKLNGQATIFSYDVVQAGGVDRNRTTLQYKDGSSESRTFDNQRRLISATNRAGAEFAWCYDASGNLCEMSGPRGGREIAYDNDGHISSMTDEAGQSTQLQWGPSGLEELTRPDGQKLRYTYDPRGNLTGFRNPLLETTSFEHDLAGRLIRTTDPVGRQYHNTYDAAGRLTSTETPTGSVQRAYDSLGRLLSITDQRGNTRSMTYGSNGALSSTTNPDGETSTITTDSLGRITSEVGADGSSIQYGRDLEGKITSTTDAEGNRHQYEYDEFGRFTLRRDPLGLVTTFEHNTHGKIHRVTDALGGTASATFDMSGRKTSVIDVNGSTTTYTYNDQGDVAEEVDAVGRRRINTYDPLNGNLIYVDDSSSAGSLLRDLSYDDAGRLTGILYQEGFGQPQSLVNYDLDAGGRRTRATVDGRVTTYEYAPSSGLLQAREDQFGNRISYEYDQVGNMTLLTYSDGQSVSYTYDSSSRLISVTDWNGNVTQYTYDGLQTTVLPPDGSTLSMSRDRCGRLASVMDAAPDGSTTYAGQWQFDAAGQTIRAQLELPLQPTLEAITSNFTYDAANQLESVNGVPVTYDIQGNLAAAPIEGNDQALTFDQRCRLVQVTNTQQPGDFQANRYDAEGLRVEVVTGKGTVRRVWDPTSGRPRLLEEHDASGNITRRYVHGLGLLTHEDAATGEVSVYHYDRRGSTVALTNAAGEVTDRYAYSPFGKCVASEGSTANQLRYCGRDSVIDNGNGIISMRSRDYAPDFARFLQKEPAYQGTLIRPGSLNPYLLGQNNPVDRVDPDGQFGFITSALGAVAGAVVSSVGQVVSNAIKGKPAFEDVAGAALDGAISGGAIGFAGPAGAPLAKMAIAGGIGSAAGNALNQGIAIAQGRQDSFDLVDLMGDFGTGAATAGVLGKFFPASAPKSALKRGGNRALSLFRETVIDSAKESGTSVGKYGATSLFNEYRDDLATGFARAGAGIGSNLSIVPDAVMSSIDTEEVTLGLLHLSEQYEAFETSDSLIGTWGFEEYEPTCSNYLIDSAGGFYGFNASSESGF